jgi:hypothetical protein
MILAALLLVVTTGLVAMAGFYGWVAAATSATLSYSFIAAHMVVYGLGRQRLHLAGRRHARRGLTVGNLPQRPTGPSRRQASGTAPTKQRTAPRYDEGGSRWAGTRGQVCGRRIGRW